MRRSDSTECGLHATGQHTVSTRCQPGEMLIKMRQYHFRSRAAKVRCDVPDFVDPTPAMESFQKVLRDGLQVQQGRVDPNVSFYSDRETGAPRFVYTYLESGELNAYLCLTPYEYENGSPVFAAGYAVPVKHRGKGLAKKIFAAGIEELRNGLRGHPPFFVEAIIDLDNVASQHVASAVLAVEAKRVTDQASGKPAFQYLRKYETGSDRG